MSPARERQLVNAAPLLYRDYGGDPMRTCMAWGFECGDGWFDVLLDGSVKLEWLIEGMVAAGTPTDQLPVAAQVKSKFGSLCFYIDNPTTDTRVVVADMERRTTHG